MKTILDILEARASNQKDCAVYTFLHNGEIESATLTFGSLYERAGAIAAAIRRYCEQGDRALLLYHAGLDFIAAFFGCLFAGVIAVPVYPPRLNNADRRLLAIKEDAHPSLLLTTRQVLSKGLPESFANIESVPTDLIAPARYRTDQSFANQDPAFLQYTSGSTGSPKGVVVSHGNIMSNSACLKEAAQYCPETIAVTWLPHFHDMGLIEGLLQPVVHGFHTYIFSPVAFLQNPLRWLSIISRYRVTHSGAPNFAYDLCTKYSSQQALSLDLSSWSLAYNAAEAVRYETVEAFAAAFAPYGFKQEAFYPAYGLAEATLQVAGGVKGRAPRYTAVPNSYDATSQTESVDSKTHSRKLVSCGRPLADTRITIVCPESRKRCDDGHEGEIWVAGGSVAQGYWRRDRETFETFHAYICGTEEGPFLRTGDLGMVINGELFITGRLKETIIVQGRKHYPQDIEDTARGSYELSMPAKYAAFGVSIDNREEVILLIEVHRLQVRELGNQERLRWFKSVALAIAGAVCEEYDVRLHSLVFVKQNSIPRTSSGKIQRHMCKQLYLLGAFEVLYESKPGSLQSPMTQAVVSSGKETS